MIKIVSWNVNGLRAVYKKGFIDILKELNPDIICLQETKALPEQLPKELLDIQGYQAFFFSAQRKGYSGVAIYTRKNPLLNIEGINHQEFDLEGRVLTHEYDDFYLVNCYVPNAQAELARIEYRENFNDALKDYLLTLNKKKKVVLCGDLNVAHQPIDLKNPKANERNPGYSIQERDKFDELLNAGFIDTFRHLYPEEVSYTWWSYRFNARQKNVGWRIDYFLISKDGLSTVKEVVHHNEIYGSDHCPISLILDL